MQPFFLWNIQYNKDAVEKHTFGSVGETAGTEIGDKRCSEGGAMVKTTGCYVEFCIKNNSTNSVKSALHGVCTFLLYTIHHVGWTKVDPEIKSATWKMSGSATQSEVAKMEFGICVLDLCH
jgi:hypothetical protein